MKKYKVFCIGFHRTGTTSLQTALEVLDYKVVGMRPGDWDSFVNGNYQELKDTCLEFDALRDMPWPLVYKWAASEFESAKFILTYRDPDSWVRSCVGNYKAKRYDMFPAIYGFDKFLGNEKNALARYQAHIAEVREFFKSQPSKFLEIEVTSELNWSTLCEFLGEDIPPRRFPHANRRPKSVYARFWHFFVRHAFPKYYRKKVRDQ